MARLSYRISLLSELPLTEHCQRTIEVIPLLLLDTHSLIECQLNLNFRDLAKALFRAKVGSKGYIDRGVMKQ